MNQEKKYSCIAIDNEKELLENLIKEVEKSPLFSAKGFTNIKNASQFIKTHKVDLILLDVELNDGIVSYDHLNELPFNTPIVFITAFPVHVALACFKAKENRNVISCMCKPFVEKSRLELESMFNSYLKWGLQEAVQKLKCSEVILYCEKEITGDCQLKIRASEIIAIEPLEKIRGCKVSVLNLNSQVYIRQRSVKDVFVQLNKESPETFIFVGRQGIVNSKHVRYAGTYFYYEKRSRGGKELKISIPRRQLAEVRNLYYRYTQKKQSFKEKESE